MLRTDLFNQRGCRTKCSMSFPPTSGAGPTFFEWSRFPLLVFFLSPLESRSYSAFLFSIQLRALPSRRFMAPHIRSLIYCLRLPGLPPLSFPPARGRAAVDVSDTESSFEIGSLSCGFLVGGENLASFDASFLTLSADVDKHLSPYQCRFLIRCLECPASYELFYGHTFRFPSVFFCLARMA